MDAPAGTHEPWPDPRVRSSLDGEDADSAASTTASSDAGSEDAGGVVVRVLGAPPAGSAAPAAEAAGAAPRMGRRLRNALVGALLPLLACWWLLALLLAVAASMMVWPSWLLAARFYWALPFTPFVWRSTARRRLGWLGALLLRLQFEGAHCTSVLARLLTLPLRPHTPSFLLLGFPKAGTTSMASYLRRHPGISGLAGMPGHEAFVKESHFLGGILGRSASSSRRLYRSFFPTILTRWWAEVVRGVPRWMCFDACPTTVCLPYAAARVKAMAPDAKLVVMVRDPVAGVFSAENMLRGMGVPLDWTLTTPLAPEGEDGLDPRFKFGAEDDAFWRELEALPPGAPLPADLPERFFFRLHSYLTCGRCADRLAPWIQAFGRDRLLLVDYERFVADPEATVLAVLRFVGADTSMYRFKAQAPLLVGDYRGKRVDPGVAAFLRSTWFSDSADALARLMASGPAVASRK